MNKKKLLLILTTFSLIGISIPAITAVSCNNSSQTNNNVNTKPYQINNLQLKNIRQYLQYFFQPISYVINNRNVNVILGSDKKILKELLNHVLSPSGIAICSDKDYLKIFDNTLKYDNKGYQIINVGIHLNIKQPPQFKEGYYKIKLEKIDDNEYYLVTSIITNYNPTFLNNDQLLKIQNIFDKYFQPINTIIDNKNINQILGDKQSKFLLDLKYILNKNKIDIDSKQTNILSVWESNDFNFQDGYRVVPIAIKINAANLPKCDSQNSTSIQINTKNNNKYLICNVVTQCPAIININLESANIINNWINNHFNSNIEDWKTIATNQTNATNELNQLLNQYHLIVKNIDFKNINIDPITFEISLTFDSNINFDSTIVPYFEQVNPKTIKLKKHIVTGCKTFANNYKDYINQITNLKWTDYQVSSLQNNQPWIKLNWNYPNDSLFDPLFNNFNTDVLKNDVLNLLKTLIDNGNYLLKFHINNLDVNYKNGICSVNLNFNIYNPETSPITLNVLVPNNETKKVIIPANQIINSNLIFQQPWNRAFDYDSEQINGNVNINYYFHNIDWWFANQDFHYENFYLSQYSNGFKRRVINANFQKGYFDIAQQGNQYLSNLTLADIKNDINNKFNLFNQNFQKIIVAFQKIFHSLTLNETTNKSFLINNAQNLGIICEALIKKINPNLIGIQPIIEKIFNGSTLAQVLGNKQTKNYLFKIFKNQPNINKLLNMFYQFVLPNNSTSFGFAYDMIIKSLCGESSLITIPLPENLKAFFKSKEIKNLLLNDIKTKPLVDILILHGADIIKNINTYLMNNKSILWETIYYFVLAVSYRGLNGNILDSLTAMIKDKKTFINNQEMFLIESLLSCLNINPTFIKKIKQIFLDNTNFNKETLRTIFNVLGSLNPNGNLNQAYDYGQYFQNNINKKIDIQGQYNQLNHNIDLTIKMTYSLTQDIVFNYKDIFNGWVSKPTQTLLSWMPNKIVFPTNSQWTKTIHLKNKLDYIVIENQNGENVLTWQANDTKITYDFDFEKTLTTLYQQTDVKLNWFLVDVLKTFLYGQQNIYQRYIADAVSIKTNPQIIQNYSNNVAQNNYVVVKNVSETYIKNLKQTILENIKLEKIPYTNSQIDYQFTIDKTQTTTNFNYYSTINDLFDLTNTLIDNNDFQYTLQTNVLSQITLIDKTLIIAHAKLELRFKSPVCFYEQKTKKYYWKNNWSFSFLMISTK